ncbi:T6SS immunity protein Tli3 family protein [Klebsiella variicola]|uniref:T6SS immunity protein Tli3 family protein n=1 Tax=Klebsiella variicola TaxID=244366 RepID=UPI003C6D5019
MSGSQKVEESRKVETDAPSQVLYRIDKYRYLTLENYISCDKGGRFITMILRGK